MAAIFIIAGGVLGFASAVASLFLMETTLLTALAIWSGTGLLTVIVGTAFALMPRRDTTPQAGPQHTV